MILDDAGSTTAANIVVVANATSLSKGDQTYFKRFCESVKDAHDTFKDHYGGWRETVARYGKHEYDSLVIAEPHFSGMIATNLEFIVTFGKEDGRYVCRRLILEGH